MENEPSRKEEVIIKMLQEQKAIESEHFLLIIPSFISKKLASYMLIQGDILFVKDLVSEIITAKTKREDERNTIIEASLWYSLIVTYGKCFTQNDIGYSKLEEKDCFGEDELGLIEIHKNIMNLRHSFIAHRGDTENETAIVFIKIPKNEPVGNLTEFKISSTKSVSPSIEKLNDYLELFNHLLKILDNKIQKQTEKINLNFLNEIDQEYWKYFIL